MNTLAPSESQLSRVRRAFLRDNAAVASGLMLVFITLFVLLAPWVGLHDPLATNPARRLATPLSAGYTLGSDEIGRDILSRLAYGGRTSLTLALAPVAIATVIGGALGLTAGYVKRLDTFIMRPMDVLLAFPSVLLAIGVTAALGPGVGNLVVALVIVAIPPVARVIRAAALQTSALDFVLAARAVGVSDARIAFRHVLPNAVGPVIVFSSLDVGRMLILASGLSFLGLGVQPPDPDWGAMLATGRQYMVIAPHVATVPGLLIFVVAVAVNTVGDALRDALDPRMGER